MRLSRARHHVRLRVVAVLLVGSAIAGACSEQGATAEQFCEKLSEVTGPAGVEVALEPGDPARIDGLVIELGELHERAPDAISATTRRLLTFFQTYQRAARDERRDVLAQNENALIEASSRLDDYALNECGLFLQRAVPTPIPTANPSIEAPLD